MRCIYLKPAPKRKSLSAAASIEQMCLQQSLIKCPKSLAKVLSQTPGSWQLVPDPRTGDIKRPVTSRDLVRGTTHGSAADERRRRSASDTN